MTVVTDHLSDSFVLEAPPAPTAALVDRSARWPGKRDLLGVMVSVTTYRQAAGLIIAAARRRRGATVTHLPVHGLVTAATDAGYRARINQFDIVAPDGQPVRWAMNLLHKTRLADRCYGPELMLRLCARAAEAGIGVYLYGSTPGVVAQLGQNLMKKFPSLKLAGCESPPFRPLTPQEDQAVVRRINDSGAGLLFIGLGCPRQDVFAHEHRGAIHAVQLCVGAAFDFLAGNKRMAPAWMQGGGLEWLFRLLCEPGRLWRRYFVTNTIFLALMIRRLLRGG